MPTDAESLRITSSQQERNVAVSSCIQQLLAENPGMDQKQAVAICIDKANKSMGTKESIGV